MKLASFSIDGISSFGLVQERGIVDLRQRVGLPDMKALIAAGLEIARPFTEAAADYPLDAVTWLPPVAEPMHMLGIGLNTRSHFAETSAMMNRTPGDYPSKPRIFSRSPLSVVGNGADILLPRVSGKLDYEAEIVVVIGRPARYVSPDEARACIAGFACGNDGSVRDYQIHSSQVTAGKNFYCSGSWGPWIVTQDEAALKDGSDEPCLELRVNGNLRQRLALADLIFNFGDLVSYISEFIPLQPGDAIFTGSPEGVGALKGDWLRPGDLVEISSPTLGTLHNRIRAE